MRKIRLAYQYLGDKSVNILIVEDNAAIRRMISRTIRHLATEIHECTDGADALEDYTQHRPDIVFMDVRMPRMDGLAATRQIRKHYPSARIVIVTDYDMDDLRTAAFEAGAEGYALKDNLCQLEEYLTGANTEPEAGL